MSDTPSTTARERLRRAIDRHQDRLRAAVPPDHQAAILALIRPLDRLPHTPGAAPQPDLITGHRLPNLSGNKALHLCLAAADDAPASPTAPNTPLDDWAERFLDDCARLAEAELVLAHCETGFMRLVDDGHGRFDAWIATKRLPATWRERDDVDWWAAFLAQRHEPELRALHSARPDLTTSAPARDAFYRRLADLHLERMAYQLGYPPDATIGGCTIQTYRDVLAHLIARALDARDRGQSPVPQSEHSLIAALASALAADPAVVARALSAFTLDRAGAAYHAAVPGVASPPLVRLAPDRLVWSLHGLTTEPLLFLTRELRRRDAQDYHNTAHLREGVFRRDLYALFADKRFVTSPGRIELRRAAGDVRTDVDAVVFDRKTGTLALFELKSHDPFARSPAELARQRDNVLYANRQLSGILDWLKRHGPDALLARLDPRTAKTFRAHKVFPFVLGRYLAHFPDGPEPDRRAAWGTWPQVLRLLDGPPVRAGEANPLASLFGRLTKDVPTLQLLSGDVASHEITFGAVRLFVYPSYAAFQARTAGERGWHWHESGKQKG
jgi:hypothetical protein